jgi:GNAT superfamily N-acetyltransferase
MTAIASLVVARATIDDLPGIVAVYGDDEVGGAGDAWSEESRPAYERGFHAIAASPAVELYVARHEGAVVGTIQVLFSPHIGGHGGLRCILESVFVSTAARGQGVGAAMLAVAEERARARGATLITLSSDARRVNAHRFYEQHGYAKTSVAFKKRLAR